MLLRCINAVGAAPTLVHGDAFRIAQKAVLHETPEFTFFFFFFYTHKSGLQAPCFTVRIINRKYKTKQKRGGEETLHDYIKK